MSHYTVMVIGPVDEDELAVALAPYDENLECSPRFVEASGDDVAHMAEHYSIKIPADATAQQTFELLYPQSRQWWGQEMVLDNDRLGYYSTYNPNSKWDWWTVGGRWSGYFPLKDGTTCDRAKKGDIDFAGRRAVERIKADNAYMLWSDFLAKNGQPPVWDPPKEGSIVKYRDEYHNNPVIKELHKTFPSADWGFMFDPVREFANTTHDEYIKNAEISTLLCWATLFGEWLAPGNMGWWGISDDEHETRQAYYKQVHDIINKLDDDEIITVVDCHI